MSFNENDDKSLSLAYGCQVDIAIIKKFDINDISIILEKFILQTVFSH